jgi:hypothetical protein
MIAKKGKSKPSSRPVMDRKLKENRIINSSFVKG